MPRGDVPGRGAGLVEIEERIAALEHISERLSERFERLLDLDHVDLADFDLEPASGPQPAQASAASAAAGAREDGGGRPVTAEATVRAVKGLAKSKDAARVRVHANTVFCALKFGNIEARATACSVEAAKAVVGLVAKSLVFFEYTEIYNKSRTMSKRDVDQANVRLRLATPPARPLRCVVRWPPSDALASRQVLVLQLQYSGVQAMGQLISQGSVALGRAEKAGATGALLLMLESTVATIESDAETSTPSCALAPTVLALVLKVLRDMASILRSLLYREFYVGYIPGH